MSKFHNPYHFVPVKKRTDADKQHDLPVDEARNGNWGGHSHAAYGKGLHSGRLVCRLTTETPIFIGGRQHDDTAPKLVDHFMLNDEPAIPASSLRGLLSSIAEAASNSALRVLYRDQILSYRYGMKQNFSALGMVIVEKNEDGSANYFLKPLVMPSLDKKEGYYCYPATFANRPTEYAPMFRHFDKPPLKVFVNKQGLTSYKLESPEFYYLRLDSSISFNDSKTGVKNHNALRFSSKDQSSKMTAIGQQSNMVSVSSPIAEADWKKLPEADRRQYTRGIIRVMRSPNRTDIPFGKKHELFIPFHVDIEKDGTKFSIPASVVKHFHDICDQRTEDNELHPYEPVGTRPARNGDKLRLKHGDIVYFAPNADGKEVAEVSFSSIWRGAAGRMEEYFDKVDPDLLPFNSNRTRITAAELLFGFVQDENGNTSLAYKGKVRISNATLVDGQENPYTKQEVTLKILSSPKPPSPSLYFKSANNPQGGYIAKASLKSGNHHPQGRKLYLHHKVAEDQTPWKTDHESELLNQKNRIKPLRSKLSFKFSIDFDNLTDWELGLLCYAVRPTPEFRHKIGMGKPLGLGTVRVDPEALEIVDRSKRYSPEGFISLRYASASFDLYRSIFTKEVDTQIANALKVLGNPTKVKFPVHTPQVEGIGLEEETFKWFVANDVGSGSEKKGNKIKPVNCCLKPITKDDLPELERLQFAYDGTPPSGGGKQKDGHKPSASHNPKSSPGNKFHHGGNIKPESKSGESFSNNPFAAAYAKAQDKKK